MRCITLGDVSEGKVSRGNLARIRAWSETMRAANETASETERLTLALHII